MGKTGVINRDFTGEENNVYHDVIRLFKIYRAVNWRMQIKVNQVKHRIREEYGTDLDEFLDSIYQAGMDINQDLDDMKQRIEVINRSNKFLKLIDEAVELMRNFHPQGERYYWVLYYSYMSARKAENIAFKQWCICQNQEQKRIPEYEKCTVCFVHLYNRDLPLGRIRDHDNFEEKHVLDVISNFFLASDSGLHVDTYHITRMAEQDATEVYIMDTENFPKWLQKM